MKFMALLKGSRESEAYVPSKEDFARMDAFIEEARKAGWLLATGGLQPSVRATRVTFAGDKRVVTDGPFTESKELIASYALIEVGAKQEAIDRTLHFPELIGGGEVDAWRVYEPSDFGLAKP